MKKNRRSRIALCMITIFVLSISSVYATDKIDSPMKGPRYDFKTEYGKLSRKHLLDYREINQLKVRGSFHMMVNQLPHTYIFQMLEDPLLVCL